MIKDTINGLIQLAAEELNYSVYDSSLYLKGENTRIIVKIDSLEGISHDDCESYSKRLAFLLDNENILPNYSLEISSPGVTRELRGMDDYKRFMDSPVKIIYMDEGEQRKVIKGTLESVDGDMLLIASENDQLRIPFSMIVQANLDY